MAELEEAGRDQCTTDALLSATSVTPRRWHIAWTRLAEQAMLVFPLFICLLCRWRMVWTTEKETLFILKNAPAFGSQAGQVFQVIDVEAGSLSNGRLGTRVSIVAAADCFFLVVLF